MKLKSIFACVIFMIAFSASATITAVLNTDANSSTGLSFLTTCSSSESPVLKIKLWNSGSTYSIPTDRIVVIQWFKYGAISNQWLEVDRNLGSTIGVSPVEAIFDLTLRDENIQFQWSSFAVNTGTADRYNGTFFAKIKVLNFNTGDSDLYTTNFITITEGQQPIVDINGTHNNSNHYNVLSGCNSGNVMLKLNAIQTCGLDEFSINIWQTDGFGNDIGSHYFRALTSGEVADIIPGGSGMNIKVLNATGGSGGTITMSTGNYYSVALEYKGQHTTQVAYLSIHYKPGTWDLVIADNVGVDGVSGYEPIDKYDNDVFRSPYLWNKLSTTANQSNGIHENPDYSTVNTSKMMYKVKNVGCSTSLAGNSGGATLRLFWTRARTGDEPWAKTWKYDLANNWVLDPDNSTHRVGGSEITIASPSFSVPYNATSTPVELPAISAGATYTVTFANGTTWYPPNPAWYDASSGPMNSDGSWPIVCLLARINETSTSSTLDPITYEPTGTTDAILPYVKNNNNVATRNSWLVNSPQHIVTTGRNWHHGWATALITNISATAKKVNICVDLLPEAGISGTFLDYGSIKLATTNNLNTYWSNGGSLTTAITQNSTSLFTVTNGTHACLNNVLLPAGIKEHIGLKFVFDASLLPNPAKDYVYQVSQIRLDSIGGDTISYDTIYGSSVAYLVNVPIESPVPADNRFTVGTNTVQKNAQLQVYPNPSNNLITVKINTELEGAELIIMDVKGQVIRMYKYNQKGSINETINTSLLPSGIYFIQYKSGDTTETVKVSVNH